MVSQTIELPNVRKFFIPDPGHIIVDADLKGADAQVVAWEADDDDLKAAFRAGVNIHNKNAIDLWGEEKAKLGPDGKVIAPFYKQIKQGVHATNYGGSAYGLAFIFGGSKSEAAEFQKHWFTLHPGIFDWHDRTQAKLNTTRTIFNAFGYRIVYFDRPESLLPEALAWTPQSTVAIIARTGGRLVHKHFPWAEMLLQVHDSIIFQIPIHRERSLHKIIEAITIEVPYSDPLIIPWSVKTSTVSWGDCENWKEAA